MKYENMDTGERITVLGEIVNEERDIREVYYLDSDNTPHILYLNKFLSSFVRLEWYNK